jgi:hypothetical protein
MHSQKRIGSCWACCFGIARIAEVEDQRIGGAGIRIERQVPQLVRGRHARDLVRAGQTSGLRDNVDAGLGRNPARREVIGPVDFHLRQWRALTHSEAASLFDLDRDRFCGGECPGRRIDGLAISGSARIHIYFPFLGLLGVTGHGFIF